jgi:hypothetical protein
MSLSSSSLLARKLSLSSACVCVRVCVCVYHSTPCLCFLLLTSSFCFDCIRYGASLIVSGEITFEQLMTAMLALMLGALGLGQAMNNLGDLLHPFLPFFLSFFLCIFLPSCILSFPPSCNPPASFPFPFSLFPSFHHFSLPACCLTYLLTYLLHVKLLYHAIHYLIELYLSLHYCSTLLHNCLLCNPLHFCPLNSTHSILPTPLQYTLHSSLPILGPSGDQKEGLLAAKRIFTSIDSGNTSLCLLLFFSDLSLLSLTDLSDAYCPKHFYLHCIPPHLTTPHHTTYYLPSPHLHSPHSPHLTSPHSPPLPLHRQSITHRRAV